MEKYKDLKARLERELEDVNRKANWTSSDSALVRDFTQSIKNIYRINEMCEGEDEEGGFSGARRRYYRDGGYSMRYRPMYDYPMADYPMNDYPMAEGDYSSYRGQRRDSRGRFSGHDDHMTREEMIAEMRRMLGEATAEKDRNAIMSAINTMEK